MEYLIRFVQVHETFRRPEVQALATLADINVEFLVYSEYVRSFIIKKGVTILLLEFELFLELKSRVQES